MFRCNFRSYSATQELQKNFRQEFTQEWQESLDKFVCRCIQKQTNWRRVRAEFLSEFLSKTQELSAQEKKMVLEFLSEFLFLWCPPGHHDRRFVRYSSYSCAKELLTNNRNSTRMRRMFLHWKIHNSLNCQIFFCWIFMLFFF